jgi:NADPH-dependent 2,4-dienoyl-CoA reductase/sulfur reductase-like enzyme
VTPKRLVVIGGVAGGMSAAAKAKRQNPALLVTVFERGAYISYGACGLPYAVSGVVPELDSLIARTPAAMRERGVDVRVHHEVTEVDHDGRYVRGRNLETGEAFCAPYDALVLATGTLPVCPQVPGTALPGVHVMRRLEDAAALREAIASGAKRAVVIGGGYIGLETVEAFVTAGLSVRVLERQPGLLLPFGPKPSALALEEVAARAEVMLGTELLGFEGRGRLEGVATSAGTFPAEVALVAVGVRPNNALAKALGLRLGPAEAVLTDAQLRTDRDGVFAVGDLTAAHHRVTQKPAWLPLGDTANRQGRVAGTVIGGGDARFRGVVGTAITKVFERALATTGLTRAEAQRHGFDAQETHIVTTDRARYYPGHRPLHVTLVWERPSGRLLGGQLVGYGNAVKRVDVLAALLFSGGTLQDLADLDFAYAPPFSNVWDPLAVAANVALG